MTQNHKEMTLKELEEWLGKEQVERLFLEHYLTLVVYSCNSTTR